LYKRWNAISSFWAYNYNNWKWSKNTNNI